MQADAPLIPIFHGSGRNVGDRSAAQTFLFDHGLSSLVFDQSDSTGTPTIDRLRQDGQTAYAAAWRRCDPTGGGRGSPALARVPRA